MHHTLKDTSPQTTRRKPSAYTPGKHGKLHLSSELTHRYFTYLWHVQRDIHDLIKFINTDIQSFSQLQQFRWIHDNVWQSYETWCHRKTTAFSKFQLKYFRNSHTKSMKIALREMQTLRAGCSKAEPKIFTPPQTLFPGMHECQNLISWRWWIPSPTDPV